MSLPIDIPRRATRSALTSLSSSSSASSTSTSLATTPSSSLGLYIPIHKRTLSKESRTSHGRPVVHSHIYTVDFLLSLRPTADESMRSKLRASCPELVISQRIRKSLEFHDRQRLQVHQDLQPNPYVLPNRHHIDVGVDIHRVPALPSQKQPAMTPHSVGRVLPRRNSRAVIRPSERRRQAWEPIRSSAGTWRGIEEPPRRLSQVV